MVERSAGAGTETARAEREFVWEGGLLRRRRLLRESVGGSSESDVVLRLACARVRLREVLGDVSGCGGCSIGAGGGEGDPVRSIGSLLVLLTGCEALEPMVEEELDEGEGGDDGDAASRSSKDSSVVSLPESLLSLSWLSSAVWLIFGGAFINRDIWVCRLGPCWLPFERNIGGELGHWWLLPPPTTARVDQGRLAVDGSGLGEKLYWKRSVSPSTS